jgi:hypothetical protein
MRFSLLGEVLNEIKRKRKQTIFLADSSQIRCNRRGRRMKFYGKRTIKQSTVWEGAE